MESLILHMALIGALTLNNEVYNKPSCFQRFFNYIGCCCRYMLCCCCKHKNQLSINLIDSLKTTNDGFDTSFIGQLNEKLLNKDTGSVPKSDEQKTVLDQSNRKHKED